MPIASNAAAGSSAGLLLAAALLPLAALSLASARPAEAANTLAFTIPAEDGYGIADCMAAGSACGAAMAASWCDAHGHLKAIAFGAADITGSTPAGGSGPLETGAVTIRCGE